MGLLSFATGLATDRRLLLTLLLGQGAAWLSRRLTARTKRYGGLKDVVSFSSRMIAAQRALETLREDCLFEDPLALVLAGKEALDKALDRQNKGAEAEAQGTAPKGAKKRMDGRIAVRTRYFDDAIIQALQSSGSLQVVMLGAGMDTRPWRLHFPPGVAWYEVDQPDVLSAKTKELRGAGAQTLASDAGKADFPWKVSTWVAVEADLGADNLGNALTSAGFDMAKPTVWVGEGLLMYLSKHEVQDLLHQSAALSAPGSMALFSMVSSASALIAAKSSNDLMKTWKWGLPEADDGKQFLRKCGWETLHLDQLGEPRASYGRCSSTPEPQGTPGARRTLYWQGALA